VRAALQSERNELQCKVEHKVAALQKEVDRVTNEKSHVDIQLKEAVDQLKAKESLIGDIKRTLERLQLLQQERDAEIKSLQLQFETMTTENTTLASEKAKAVEEATRAALESKSLLEDVQAYKSKYDKLKAKTQLMSVRIMSMEKDVVDSVIKDEQIKALAEKVEVLTNTVNEAVTAKADVIIQSEEATRALLAKDREIAAREYQKNELSKRLVLLQQIKNDEMARAESALEKTALELKTLFKEVQVVKSEKTLLIEQMNTISTSNESLESQRIYLQHRLDSLVRIDRKEDMEQQRNIIELNERIISLQQAHDTALSSLKHEYEVVLSEKRSLEQTILSSRSMSNEGRVASRSSITQKALKLFEAAVLIVTDKTPASGFDLDTSETETTISSRIDGTRSEQLPIAALSSIRGSMVNEVEYNAGTVMKGGRKRTHMNSVSDGSNKSNKSPRL
jgi:epidermal growth factor receptor substrate 15